MTNDDRYEVMKMIKQAKDELRREFWDESNKNWADKAETKENVNDNTDAILELAEIVGGN